MASPDLQSVPLENTYTPNCSMSFLLQNDSFMLGIKHVFDIKTFAVKEMNQ
jgi:hypothetical protein